MSFSLKDLEFKLASRLNIPQRLRDNKLIHSSASSSDSNPLSNACSNVRLLCFTACLFFLREWINKRLDGQYLGHFQVGSYRYRSLIEGLYTLQKPYRSPIYPKIPTCSFLFAVHLFTLMVSFEQCMLQSCKACGVNVGH